MRVLSAPCLLLLRSTHAFTVSRNNSAGIFNAGAAVFNPELSTTVIRSFCHSTALKMSSDKPFSVIVEAEIKEDRMEEFLSMIENNANQSRKEPGCIRFDVLQDQSQSNKFWFYEVYESVGAVDFHKAQPHYQGWADFKESGGTISSVSHKADGVFVGGKSSS